MSVNGQLKTEVKFKELYKPKFTSTVITSYNGSDVAVTGNGFDITPYDEVIAVAVTGDMTGGSATVSFVSSATNDPAGATTISGLDCPLHTTFTQGTSNASFGALTTSNARVQGVIRTKNVGNKYIWAKVVTTAATCNLAVGLICGEATTKSVLAQDSETYTFDIGY
jgi:hypothetical protein